MNCTGPPLPERVWELLKLIHEEGDTLTLARLGPIGSRIPEYAAELNSLLTQYADATRGMSVDSRASRATKAVVSNVAARLIVEALGAIRERFQATHFCILPPRRRSQYERIERTRKGVEETANIDWKESARVRRTPRHRLHVPEPSGEWTP